MRLGKIRLEVSSGFILLLGAAIFLDGSGMLWALLPAMLTHEAGHYLAFRLCGAGVTGVRLSASGVSMDYAGGLSRRQELFAALSGPALGLVYAFLCSGLGAVFNSDTLFLCAGLGLIINCFNLLPAYPLDGGLAAFSGLSICFGQRTASRIAKIMSTSIALSLCSAGLYLITLHHGPALFLAGLWLLIFNCASIVKKPLVV